MQRADGFHRTLALATILTCALIAVLATAPPPSAANSDGAFAYSAPPPRSSFHAAAYDAARHRMIVVLDYADLGFLDLASGRWDIRKVYGPGGHRNASTVYDAAANRLIRFGGWNGQRFTDEVWTFDLDAGTQWLRLAVASGPTSRSEHAAIWDPVRNRMLVCGGFDGTSLNDVWSLTLGPTPTWTPLATAGTAPEARHSHAAVYDPVRDRLVLMGGAIASDLTNDVWALTLSGTPTWGALAPSGAAPAPRKDHAVLYDSAADRLLVIGGNAGDLANDAWFLPLAAPTSWTQLGVVGTPPTPRHDFAAIFDPAGHRAVIHGGFDTDAIADAWALELDGTVRWRYLPPRALPSGNASDPLFYDPVRDRMLYFTSSGSGERVWTTASVQPPDWREVATTGSGPYRMISTAGIYDPARDRILFFGGREFIMTQFVWELALSPTPTWSNRTNPSAPHPAPREGHTAVLDAARDRMIVFGGLTYPPSTFLDDVWVLDLATLSWTQAATSGAPPRRKDHRAIADPLGDRMLMWGGYNDDGPNHQLGDLWQLDLATMAWTELHPAGSGPLPGYSAGAIRDANRNRMVLYGADDASYQGSSHIYALNLTGPPAWTELVPAGDPVVAAYAHGVAYDSQRDLMFATRIGSGTLTPQGSASLTWADPVGVPLIVSDFSIGIESANPTVGGATLRLTLKNPGVVLADVIDVQGRLVRRLVGGSFAAGPHTIRWDGRAQGIAPVSPGLYFIRVQSAGRSDAIRVVKLQ